MTNTSTTDTNSFSKNSLITVILSNKNLVVTSTLGTTNTEIYTGTELSILTHLTRTFLNRSCPFSMGFFVDVAVHLWVIIYIFIFPPELLGQF